MRLGLALLFVLSVAILAACGGGGGGDTTVSNTQFRVAWPARTRDTMQVPLTSALSARVVLQQAGVGPSNVTIDINRDATKPEAHTATYTIPQPISPQRLGSITATFYALPSQGGDVVGTATSTATLVGTSIEFAPIVLTGTITQVIGIPTSMPMSDGPTQLQFSALNSSAGVVAVTPGSASWTISDGAQFIALTPDGIATPLAAGTAHVRVTVDGITSGLITIDVLADTAPVYSWAGAKGGNLTTPTFNAVEGNKFSVTGGKDVVVTELGYEVSPNQPTGTTAIFDANGNVLASASISGSDNLLAGYYYKAITPITLTSGSTYYIGSLHGTGSAWDYYHNTNVATVPPFIVDLGTHFKVTSTIQGGTWQASASIRHYVGNFQAHQVP
jgi:hypothetical protein